MEIVLEKTVENAKQINKLKSKLGCIICIKNQDKTKEQCMNLVGMNIRKFSLDLENIDELSYSNLYELIVPNKIFDKLYVPVQEVNISGRAMYNGVELFRF